MILVLTDADGRTVAKADITGSLWIAAHNGFVNRDDIKLRAERRGLFEPKESWLMDLMGARLARMEITGQRRVGYLQIPVFASGSMSLSLHPHESSTETKP